MAAREQRPFNIKCECGATGKAVFSEEDHPYVNSRDFGRQLESVEGDFSLIDTHDYSFICGGCLRTVQGTMA